MRCTIHSAKQATGYCAGCGSFFCDQCLVVCEDGKGYCSVCKTKLGKSAREEAAPRDSRLATKLLVEFKDGKSLQGTTYKLDPVRSGFIVYPHVPRGAAEERYIEFSRVKYVALVDSFGTEKTEAPREYQPKGSEISVTF